MIIKENRDSSKDTFLILLFFSWEKVDIQEPTHIILILFQGLKAIKN